MSYGTIPTIGQFDATSTTPLTQNPTATIQQTQAGTYYVMVRESAGGAENYSLSASTVGFSISDITPKRGSNVGTVTMTIDGARFTANETVEIIGADGSVRQATNVDWVNTGELWATFNLQGLAVGTYTVEVADGTRSTTLANGFTVDNGPAGHLVVNLIAPATLRTHTIDNGINGTQNGIVTVQYTNTGETDIAAPILDLQAVNAKFHNAVSGLVSPTEITVVGTSQSGPAGILQPGETETVAYTFAGNFGYAQIVTMTLSLGVLQGSDATIDWSSLGDSARPAAIDATDWSLIWQRFEDQVGTTTQSFVTAIDQAATRLAQIGQSTNDLGTLLEYELNQAIGIFPGLTLASTTDLSGSGAGLNLSLTRSYSSSLLDRNRLGAFGDGWTFTYDIRAVTDSSGNVSIVSSSGTEFFTLQSNGSYAAQSGNSATLTLAGGTYVLTNSSGTVERFLASGSIGSITDATSNVVTVSYGSTGAISGVTSSTGQSLTFTTNAAGEITSATNRQGETVTYTYDASGQHLVQVSGTGGTTGYTYDASGNVLSRNALTGITNTDGTGTAFTYDSEGNLASAANGDGSGRITYAYDGVGTVKETDANGSTSTLIYDGSGNIAEVQDAQGNVVRLAYDSKGELTKVTAADGSTYSLSYDSLGDLTGYTNPLGGTVSATYQAGTSLLTSYTDQDGNTTRYSYDSAGDMTGITYSDGTGTSYAYSSDGTLTSETNARGQTTTYTHNSLGEVTGETFSDGTSQTYTYDSNGNLLTATAVDGGVTRYTYNAAGELTSMTDPQGRVESYGYNAAGQKIQRVEPDGSITNYSYTTSGQLAGLTDGNGKLLVNYTYNAAGQLTGSNTGNGASTAYTYDALGNTTSIVTKDASGNVTSRITYTYDVNARPVTATSLDGSWSYTYDVSGQLTHAVFASTNASIASQDLTYVYDAAGNRVKTIFNGAESDYTTNGLNQYTSVDGTAYGYDADGNLISKTTAPGVKTTYAYNSQNQLVSTTGPDGTTTYQYDALGNLVAQTVNGVRSDYVIDPLSIATSATGALSSVAQVYNAAGAVTATYDYGNGLAAENVGGSTYYYNLDVIGNVTGLTGANGALVYDYAYDPFGITLFSGGTVANPFGYSGGWGVLTEGDGLLDLRARFYIEVLGRFISRDPIGVNGGINGYSYSANSPTIYTDPMGLNPNSQKGPSLWGRLWSLISGGATPPEVISSNVVGDVGEVSSPILASTIPATVAFSEHPWEIINTLAYLRDPNAYIDNINRYASGQTQNNISTVHSTDPNDIVGPAGVGVQKFVASQATYAYTVDFENAATATAPAQSITITQQLDSHLDWRSFRLTGFGFDNLTTTLSGNQAFYSGLLDYSATKGYDVEVTAGVNVVTGVVTWTFQTIDPATGQAPADPQAGLLPVNNANGDGQGFVSYTIKASSTVQTGDTVAAQATVVFDTNAPISTPAVVNTIDAVAPTSSVAVLPANTDQTSFDVSWSGTDDPTGSGIASYTIYVSKDGGTATAWLANTTRTNAIFTSDPGHSYAFTSIATDNAGNTEAPHATADTTIQVIAPVIAMTVALAHDTGAPSNDGITSDPTLTGTGEAGATVTFTEGSTPLGTATADASGVWTFTPTLADGSHTVTASETDSLGAHGSASVTFTLDTVPPAVTEALAHNTDRNPSDHFTSNDTLTGTGAPNATVTLTEGTALLGTATADGTGLWSFAPAGLADGSHTITASETDIAGNTGSASLTFTSDTVAPAAPTIAGISPDTGPSPTDGITDTGALTVSGAAEAGSTVALFDGTAPLGATIADGTGRWSIALATPLVQGFHAIDATATDAAGNASSASAVFSVKVQLPPTLLQATLPETVAEGHLLGNLWATLVANGQDLDQASLAVTAVGTASTHGAVSFDPLHRRLSYVAAPFDAAHPVDSFTYTLTDDQGNTVTGSVAVTVTVTGAAVPTTTATAPNTTTTATGANQRLVSQAAGQTLVGNAAGGDLFFASADTRVSAFGNGNTVSAPTGNHTIALGASGNTATLGDGNNTVSATGTGNTVTGGNGNNLITGLQGNTTITLGDGNNNITISGGNNTVNVGNGNNTINAGNGGNERVTTGNGANKVTVGGAGDTVTTGAGSDVITATGANAAINAGDGANQVFATASGDTITTGSGDDLIQATVGGATIRAGLGNNTIKFAGAGSTVINQGGNDALFDTGHNNSIVFGVAGQGLDTITGNILTNGDVFDLRTALAATGWDHQQSTLGSFLKLGAQGSNTVVSIDPSGLAGGTTTAVAVLNGTGPVTLSSFLAHAQV